MNSKKSPLAPYRTCRSRVLQKLSFTAFVASGALFTSHSARAQNDAWSTTPAGNTFTGNNWTTGSTTPGAATGTIAAGDNLFFGVSSIVNLQNDEAAGFLIGGFTFNADASAYTIAGNAFALGAGGITNNSANLQTINAAITMAATRTFTTSTGGGDLRLGGVLSGTGGLTKAGAGTLTLSGANSYSGGTTINTGTLQVNGAGVLGGGSVVNNGALVFNTTAAQTISGVISGTGALTQSGTGALTLTGNNTFSGGLAIGNATTVNANGGGSLGAGPVTVGSTVGGSGTLNFNVNGVQFANSFVLNGGTINNANGNTVLGGAANTIVVNAATTLTSSFGYGINAAFANGNVGKALELNGVLSGGAALTLNGVNNPFNEATGIWINNNANTYTGTVTVNANSGNGLALTLGGNTALQNATVNVVGVSGNAQTPYGLGFSDFANAGVNGDFSTVTAPVIGALSGNGNIRLQTWQRTVQNSEGTGAAVALTTGGNNASTTFSGILSGSGSLTKAGTGTMTLTGANTFSGGTTVNGGTVKLGSATALGAASSALTVNGAGSTLDLAGFNLKVGALSGSAGGVISSTATGASTLTAGDANNTTFAGVIQNGSASAVNLVKQGSGTLNLTGANTYTGTTSINAGTLQIGATGSLANFAGISFGGSGSLGLGDANGAVNLTLPGAIPGTTAANSIAGGFAGGNSTVTLNGAGNQTYANAFGGSGANQNNLNVVIAGTGTKPVSVLSGASTYTGTTTVNSGATLNLLNGSIANSALTVNSGGALTGSGNNASTGVIGSLAAAGGSTILLGSAISGTALLVNGDSTLGSAANAYGPGNYTTVSLTLGAGGPNGVVEQFNTAGTLTLNSGGAFINVTNPTTTGTFILANYGQLSGGNGFSLDPNTAGVLDRTVGRNTETLSIDGNSLTLDISGTPNPNVAYFNAKVSTVFNDASSQTAVNFSTDKAGNNDAGNLPGPNSNVFLTADNATSNLQGRQNIVATLGGNTSINSLNAVGSTGLLSFTINQDSGQTTSSLTLLGAGDAFGNAAGNALSLASGAAPLTINVPVIIGATQTWTNNSASLLTVGGTVSGNGAAGETQTLTLSNTGTGGMAINGAIADSAGTGTLAVVVNSPGSGVTTFAAANTYSGGTTLNAGILTATVAGAFSTGAVTINPTGTSGTAADAATLNTGGSIAPTAVATVNTNSATAIGTLNFNGAAETIGSLAGNGRVVLNNANGTALTVGNAANNLSGTFAGVISGAGSLVKAGAGTFILTGASTYTGGTTISAGTLQLSDGTANGSVTGAIVNNATLAFANASAQTFNNVVSGTGALVFNGTAPLTIAGANTYTGATTVNAGATAALGSATAFGATSGLVLNGTGTVDLNGLNLTLPAAPTGTGGVLTNATGGTTSTLTVGGGTSTLAATLSDSTGTNTGAGILALAVTGTGTNLTLMNAANTYSGGTTVGAGSILALGNGTGPTGGTQANTPLGSGRVMLGGGGTLNFNVNGVQFANSFVLNGGTINNANGNTVLGGAANTIVVNAATTLTSSFGYGTNAAFTNGNAGKALELNGVLSGGAALTLNGVNNPFNEATGIWINNNANTYTGTVTVNANSGNGLALTLGGNTALQNATVNVVGVSGNAQTPYGLGFSGFANAGVNGDFSTVTAPVIGALSGNGNIRLQTWQRTVQNSEGTGAAVALTTGGNNASTTFSGILSGTGSLTKAGTGTMTLTGANTYGGGTTVNGGTLLVNNASGSGTGNGAVTVNAGGLLGGGNGAASNGALNTLGTGANRATSQTYASGVFGMVGGAVTVASGGILAPGNSVGTLTVASLTMSTGSLATYEFNGGANDLTVVNGTLTLAGGNFTLLQEGTQNAFATSGTYNLFSYAGGTFSGSEKNLMVANPQSGVTYNFLNDTTDGLIQLQVVNSAVPEPGTWALLLAGLGALGYSRRRRMVAGR